MYPRFAAIDIGSNAIRFQVSRIIPAKKHPYIKKLEYVRFPLRLGHDVFVEGRISEQNQTKFIKLMHVYKGLIDLYEVSDYAACATSAMRNAENGPELVRRVAEDVGLKIHIIDGAAEADIINHAIYRFIESGAFLHIDVGGGSTELNIYHDQQKVAAKSFPIGSVRLIEKGEAAFAGVFAAIQRWVEGQTLAAGARLKIIGTGGNIVKLYELAENKKPLSVSLEQLENVREQLMKYTYEERLSILKLNQDRADVIIPASLIYIKVLKWAKAKSIKVPDLGLKDGLISYLYLKSEGNPPFKLQDDIY